MSSLNISDAQCHVEQALAVLSVWLEVASVADDVREFNMISSLISLLDVRPAKGTNMAMARLALELPCNAADNGEATFWPGVIAFGRQADALAKHRKGDLVSVAGNMQLNQWTGQDDTVQQGNRGKLRTPYDGPMNIKRPPPDMKDTTRRRRMTMGFDSV
jgi:hypothetical protein